MRIWIAMLLALSSLVSAAQTPAVSAPDAEPAPTSIASAAAPARPAASPVSGAATPGVATAQAVSTLTGVAISPLLGVGAVGAWKYYQTPEPERGRLPWFARPWFWIPALALVLLAVVKDTFGTVVPTALKKPLDVAEAFENKVSGLIAAGAFVPLLIVLLGEQLVNGATPAGAGLAAISGGDVTRWLLTPFAWVAFAVVWLLGHAINVLILLSPFSTVDAGLKLARTALLGTVVGTSFVNPYFGAAWALVIILVAALLAGWTFRLTVFGTVFAWDLSTLRRHRFQPAAGDTAVFLAREYEKAPVRTYGRVTRDRAGRLVFRHRPWLLLPPREVPLPVAEYCVGRGVLYPDLLCVQGESSERIAILPPRYHGHEETVTRLHRLDPPRDVGLRAVWGGMKELLGVRPARAAQPM
ncbi:MAG: hypothetical protein ACKVYV_05095 [Limisphaerales bacterium]